MNKRILTATLVGLLCGVLCLMVGIIGLGNDYNYYQMFYIVFNRTMMGVVIGISSTRLHWAVNGLILGLMVGLPFAVYEQIVKEFYGYPNWVVAILIPTGAVYGLFIEYITTKVFKFKAQPHTNTTLN